MIILTNGRGGIREGYAAGQPVLIGDHLNLTGSAAGTSDRPLDHAGVPATGHASAAGMGAPLAQVVFRLLP